MMLCAAVAVPAHAQEIVTDEDVDARDVALLPLADLNLARDEIPAVLVRAKARPYANDGLSYCGAVRSEIGDLDAVLGEDFDMPGVKPAGGIEVGRMARSVVSMLIPYRGVIREVSGAAAHEKLFKEAIVAGMMRRAYLKGLGEAMGCPYPTRPAPPEVVAMSILQREPDSYANRAIPGEQTNGTEVPVETIGEPRVTSEASGDRAP
ncbi:hypothetical protein V5740_04395 [Croceibacterium sp. TMG7-5b_MA50]|uniref:hypothetical protein n=1 Tax=Croceibacterium sp. TMG7-5b_MA50 TaxID=3121290 RepID=UPI003221ACE2